MYVDQTGNFAVGNSTTNISFNGSTMTLNGSVVSTNNVLSGAISSIGIGTLGSNYTYTDSGTYTSTNSTHPANFTNMIGQVLLSTTVNSLGGPIFVNWAGSAIIGASSTVNSGNYYVTISLEINGVAEGSFTIMAGTATSVPVEASFVASSISGSNTISFVVTSAYCQSSGSSGYQVVQPYVTLYQTYGTAPSFIYATVLKR
jgi:hypothetical protein